MILLPSLVALLLALIYFLILVRRRDDAWERFRQRYRARRRHHRPEQPSDPDFQYNQHPVDGE